MQDCIEHKQKGIGLGYASTSRRGKTYWMHRVVYCEHNDIPMDNLKDKVVRHLCDNPRCINPEHLVLGTHLDNMRDMTERNRQAKGEQQGASKLTAAQVLEIRERYVPKSKGSSQRALAKLYDVTQTTIGRIVRGEYWSHV